jgi:UDP-GlcNAc3NAcA epimerase
VHIEAGLRSFNKQMPEEINRILTDHCSTFLCVPTQSGIDNLQKEGFSLDNKPPFSADSPGVFNVGDVMFDNSLFFSELANTQPILQKLELQDKPYVLTTIHRNTNTDSPEKLTAILDSLIAITEKNKINLVLPLHPRTQKQIENSVAENLQLKLKESNFIKIIKPVSFLEMVLLEKNATLVMTDSGGVQKEAYFFKKPCLILRPQTEWVEIVASGAAVLCDTDSDKIESTFDYFYNQKPNLNFLPHYGEGNAAQKILELILDQHAN